MNELNSWTSKTKRLFPWGTIFATTANLEWGYFTQERIYVDKYLSPRSSVLVIGSGNGREAAPIAAESHSIICIDIGEMYLYTGKTWFSQRSLSNVQFAQADMASLPFYSKSFDFVFFSLFCYGADQRHAILADMHRILKPQGIILLTVWTSKYRKRYPRLENRFPVFDNEKELREDLALCSSSFEFLESAVDPVRQEYFVAVIRKL